MIPSPSSARIVVSREELANLADCTGNVSNFVTSLLYEISLLPDDLPKPVYEQLSIVTGLVEKTRLSLVTLMAHLGRILDSEELRRIENGETKNAKCRSKSQGC